jgi:hypothetical protein
MKLINSRYYERQTWAISVGHKIILLKHKIMIFLEKRSRAIEPSLSIRNLPRTWRWYKGSAWSRRHSHGPAELFYFNYNMQRKDVGHEFIML